MACTDLRKVWTDVKGHRRKVLKCMDKKATKKRRKNKKKITQPLNLADFVRPRDTGEAREGKRRKNLNLKNRRDPYPLPLPEIG